MSNPTITPPPEDPPKNTDRGRSNFTQKMDALVAWFSTLTSEMTTLISWIAAQVTAVSNSESNAAASASAASAAASTAVQKVNDQVDAFRGTSTTSNTAGVGSKSFTTQAEMAFAVGTYVTIYTTEDATVSMSGRVTAYAGTSLTVNVTAFSGSGTFTNWNIDISGAPGDSGLVLKSAALLDAGPAPTEVPTGQDLDNQEGWPTHFWIPDKTRAEVEAATGGQCTVIYDDLDRPSIMRRIPRFRYEDLGYDSELGTGTATAFDLGGGSIKGEILIGQFAASIYNGRAYSLPGVEAANGGTVGGWEGAVSACTAKGAGWHLMTMHEWAAVALWCMANGFEPRGNTDHGRAHDATHEVGVRQDGDTYGPGDGSGVGNILNGTGPVTWRHDQSMGGIADLVGNVWEWQWGLKLVDGLIHVAPNNDWTLPEGDWLTTIDGNTHYVSNESSTPTLLNSGATSTDATINQVWASLAKGGSYTESQTLQRMLFSPAGVHPEGRFYANAAGECFPLRGGRRSSGGAAGLAALNLRYDRGITDSGFGFRPAFVA